MIYAIKTSMLGNKNEFHTRVVPVDSSLLEVLFIILLVNEKGHKDHPFHQNRVSV